MRKIITCFKIKSYTQAIEKQPAVYAGCFSDSYHKLGLAQTDEIRVFPPE